MRSSHPEYRGYFFALMGSVVSLVAATLLLLQLCISGEAPFAVTLNSRRQPERLPFAIEFVSTFLAMGLGFVGTGYGQSSSSLRQPILRNGFSIANFLMIVAPVGSQVATVMLRDVGTLLFLLWPIVVGLGLWLATKHPAFRHADARHQINAASVACRSTTEFR